MTTNETLPEFLEVIEAIAAWLSRHMATVDPSTLHAIGAQIMEDALGQMANSRPPPEPPPRDEERGGLGYAIIALQNGFFRFKQVRTATRYYPWRGRIKRQDHLEMMTHLFLAEVYYIYEERLRQYLDAYKRCERVWKVGVDIKQLTDEIRRAYRSQFKTLIRARNSHTHESDVRIAEISRMQLIDLLSIKDDQFGLSAFAPRAFRAARTKLMKDIDDTIEHCGELTRVVLRRTKPIWSQL